MSIREQKRKLYDCEQALEKLSAVKTDLQEFVARMRNHINAQGWAYSDGILHDCGVIEKKYGFDDKNTEICCGPLQVFEDRAKGSDWSCRMWARKDANGIVRVEKVEYDKPETKKCCETCKWRNSLDNCTAADPDPDDKPFWFSGKLKYVGPTEGQNCKCWAEKE